MLSYRVNCPLQKGFSRIKRYQDKAYRLYIFTTSDLSRGINIYNSITHTKRCDIEINYLEDFKTKMMIFFKTILTL